MAKPIFEITDFARGLVPPESRQSGWLLHLFFDVASPEDLCYSDVVPSGQFNNPFALAKRKPRGMQNKVLHPTK